MERGSWAAARLWAVADIRIRWKALLAVGLIVGLAAGLALASLAGARRTDSALDRLRERTNASDALLFTSQVGAYHPDWPSLARRPEVRALAPWALVFGELDGDPEGLLFTPADETWMRVVDAPVIVDGRMFDPAADDEILVAEGFAADEGIRVDDTLAFTPYTVDEVEGTTLPLRGPRLTMRIVGIMRTPMEELFVQDGFAVASPGILTRHPDVNYFENAVVQLVDPGGGTAALEAHATVDLAAGTPILDLLVVSRRVTATTDVERSALILLGAVIALAGLVLAGQVVLRSASLIGRDAHILEAVGLPRRAMVAASLLSHLPAVLVALLACAVTAIVTSRWLPFGLAGRLEPDRGVHLDALIVLPGLLVMLGALLAGIAAGARVAAARRGQAPEGETRGLIDWVRRHASAGVGIGATMAFRKGSGRRDLPVRPALLGAVVGMLGVASAITLDAGLSDALHHPERAGVAWDGQITPGTPDAFTEAGFVDDFVQDVKAVPGVTDLVQVDRTSVGVQGTTGVPAYALRPVGGDDPSAISFVTLEGRAPLDRGEIAIGPDTARSLGVAIGDTIGVGTPPVLLMVVGLALFPAEVHAGFDQGAWLTPADYDTVKPPADESTERVIAVRFAEGAERRGLTALQSAAAPYQGFAGPAELPPELANLRHVRPIPKLLAGFLATLALAALLHVQVTTTRVRAHDFAVLRALGFTRWGTRVVINVQGTAVFLTGLVLGTPIGVAAGRVGWRLIAERVPLEQSSPMAAVAIAALVPVALVVAQVVAFGPGRQVVRQNPGQVLRAE
jgi:ABC-type lipoprotein release transport system permease subunit